MSQILGLRARAGASYVLLALTLLPACASSTAASSAPATPAAPPADAGGQAEAGHVGPPRAVRVGGDEVYLSGFNIAWFDFAKDIGRGLDERRLRQASTELLAVGGNTMRWWIHTDGTTTPQWGVVDGQRRVVGPGGSFIEDMRRALDIAAEYHVFVVPSLWSFDMLRDNAERRPPVQDNYRLLVEDAVLDSYIDNALVPMVRALNGHPALGAWELFNEPENMTEPWFVKDAAFYGGPVPTLERLQRTQAKMAAAIHRTARAHNQVALVTTGSKSMGKYNSDVAGGINLYRDDRMVAAADGDPLATLDFYEPHYYDNEGDGGAWSVFHHPAAYWNVDKPIVIGEFYTHEPLSLLGEVIQPEQMCQRLIDHGYAGGWPWQWNEYPEPVKACLRAARPPLTRDAER
jgi:mannan endo-1,4-beta-mannosidase